MSGLALNSSVSRMTWLRDEVRFLVASHIYVFNDVSSGTYRPIYPNSEAYISLRVKEAGMRSSKLAPIETGGNVSEAVPLLLQASSW
jgi:hypothetical protein